SVFVRGQANPAAAAGSALAAKIHAADPALWGALNDWLAQVYAVDEVPDAAMRAALPPGAVYVNRAGHQFTRYTVSFHAPDQHDAEIEHLKASQAEERYRERSAQVRAEIDELHAEAARDRQALEEARARAADIGGQIASARAALEAARAAHIEAETALAEQRR